MVRWSVVLGLALLLVGAIYLTRQEDGQAVASATLVDAFAAPNYDLFARATEPGAVTFPEAFGAHPEYLTEWWYYTGNVESVEGRAFGYQFTIFRRGLEPGLPERASELATSGLYMGHFNVTDVAGVGLISHERFQREGPLAGAQAAPYEVWLDDWRVAEIAPGRYQLTAAASDVAIDLTLTDLKGPILHGDEGLSQKSAEVGNASYYYSQTRLETEGEIRVGENRYEVSGFSWKDHEYSTSALAEGTEGWDWFSIQLSDGRELMYYQLRREDGGIEPASSGTLIREDAATRHLTPADVEVEVLGRWESPANGGIYPSGWRLRVPDEQIDLTIEPLRPDQEVVLSATYWEGAVAVSGTSGGEPVTGRGYVELTGYDGANVPFH